MDQSIVSFLNLVFVPVGLMLIMFSMGLTLALRDFGLVLASKRLVAAGLAGQLVAMPLLALAIGALFFLPPELALGVFILGITPAGTTSNALTFIGRGNVALAVVLTALSSLITVFTIPLLLGWALPWFLGSGDAPPLSILGTILQLARITILPMVVGMLVRRFAPALAQRLARWLRPVSLIVLIGVIGLAVAASAEMVLANLVRAAPPLLVLNLAAMATGLLLARLVRADTRDSMTLAIEVGVHNVTLATFLTLTVLDSLPLAVAQNIYGVLMLINAGLLIRWFRARIATRDRV